jgi:DEAD/DEAH box helicase domain-containing protein
VAVFLDGWQFHRNIIAVDLAKRMAIAKSGRFSVWTLTWADVELWLNPKADAPVSPWSTLLASDRDVVGDLVKRLGLGHMLGFRALPSMAQLRSRLCTLDHEMMRRHAAILGLGILMPHGDPVVASGLETSALGMQLSEAGLTSFPSEQDRRLGGRKLGDGMIQIATGISAAQISQLIGGQLSRDAEPGGVMRWHPAELTPDGEVQKGWHALWQTANLLFPLSRFWAGSDEGCAWSPFQEATLVRVSATGTMDLAWIEVAEYASREVQGWIEALSSLDITAPVVGFELLDEKGRIVAEAELAWVGQQVAVLVGTDTDALVEVFMNHGWQCFVATSTDIDAGLLAVLQAKEGSP